MDGFRWTVTGGVVGLLLTIMFYTIIYRALSVVTDIRMDWLIGITIPIISGIGLWYAKFTSRMKEIDKQSLMDAINKKADHDDIILLEQKLTDHKEQDKQKYEMFEERFVGIDNKLDIIINNLIKKNSRG